MTGHIYKLLIAGLLVVFGISTEALANEFLKDPTQPLADKTKAIPLSDMEISAIFAGKDRSLAIINGNTFVVGDKIADLTITAIDINGITLKNKDGEEFRVDRSYSTIKSPTIKNRKGKRENSD
jgi:hypothetical protein